MWILKAFGKIYLLKNERCIYLLVLSKKSFMNENNIGRRHMIKVSSVAALTAIVSPSLVAGKNSPPDPKENNSDVVDNNVCFMSALEMAALLRTKKISAREVMQ